MVRLEERWTQRPMGCWVIVLDPCLLGAAASIRASGGTVWHICPMVCVHVGSYRYDNMLVCLAELFGKCSQMEMRLP